MGSVHLMLGSNPKEKREEHDYYATHPHAVEIALPVFEKIGLGGEHKRVWECACGEGHISKTLEKHGYRVLSTDLIDRGYGHQQDFLETTMHNSFVSMDIITNPPFALAEQFVEHAKQPCFGRHEDLLPSENSILGGEAEKTAISKVPA